MDLRVRVRGVGGAITGFSCWNYTNGGYVRWRDLREDSISATEARLAAVRFTNYGESINNRDASLALDGQHYRFVNGVRQDATLFGYVDVVGNAVGETLSLNFAVGTAGIAREGTVPHEEQVYFGFGDEAQGPFNDGYLQESPQPDALLRIVPEPATAVLALAALLASRPRRATRRSACL